MRPDEPKILSRIGRVRNRKVISWHTMPINLSKAWQSKWTMNIGCAVLLGGLIAGFSYAAFMADSRRRPNPPAHIAIAASGPREAMQR